MSHPEAIPPPQRPAPVWQVKRRWIPRLAQDTLFRRFWRRSSQRRDQADAASDIADAAGLLDMVDIPLIGGIASVIGLIALLFAFGFVIVPVLIAIIEVVGLLVLCLLAVGARVLFRRPWLIEARDGTGRVLRWRVVGWRASTQRADDIRSALAMGVIPPNAEVVVDPTLPDA